MARQKGVKRIVSFDTDLYFKVVKKMMVYEDRMVALLDGTEIECEIQ